MDSLCAACILGVLLCLGGCIDEHPPAKHDMNALYQQAKAAPQDEPAGPILPAVVTLVRHGLLVQYAWTPPTTGTTAVRYECDLRFTVPDTTAIVVRAGADSLTLRVRGIDAEGRVGPWSVGSEVLAVGAKQ